MPVKCTIIRRVDCVSLIISMYLVCFILLKSTLLKDLGFSPLFWDGRGCVSCSIYALRDESSEGTRLLPPTIQINQSINELLLNL